MSARSSATPFRSCATPSSCDSPALPVIGGYTLGALYSGRLASRLPPDRQANIGYGVLTATSATLLLPQQLLLAATAVGLPLAAVMMGALAPWFAVSMQRLALNAFQVNLAGVLVWRSALGYRRRASSSGA